MVCCGDSKNVGITTTAIKLRIYALTVIRSLLTSWDVALLMLMFNVTYPYRQQRYAIHSLAWCNTERSSNRRVKGSNMHVSSWFGWTLRNGNKKKFWIVLLRRDVWFDLWRSRGAISYFMIMRIACAARVVDRW